MPVHRRFGFDFDVAINLQLAGKPQGLFVPQAGEKGQGIADHRNLFEDPLRRAVLKALLDVDAAAGAQTKSKAIGVVVWKRIQLHACFESFLAKVGSSGNFDGLLFFDKRDSRHFDAVPESDSKRASGNPKIIKMGGR